MFERLIAKLGIVGVLAILLALSVLVNFGQFGRAQKADARCAARNADLAAQVDQKTAEQEKEALGIGRETADRAEDDADRIGKETIRYVERIREVRIPVPAECDGPIPDRVQDAVRDAARAADRRV